MALTVPLFPTFHSTSDWVDESPVLTISSAKLKSQADLFTRHFPGLVSYAVKANANGDVVRLLSAFGVRAFDVASIAEMALVSVHAPGSKLHYHNPVRSVGEIQCAYHQYGCRRFAVDHPAELDKLRAVITCPQDVEIAVRFRSAQPSRAVQAFKSKFGATELEAARLLRQASAIGFQTGLTFHPGSQTTSPSAYAEHISAVARISETAGIPLKFLNVGGGFPIAYSGTYAPVLEAFFKEIAIASIRWFGDQAPNLECEPGRALVGPGGSIHAAIKAVRRDTGELFLNDGIYGGLMEVYQFPALRPPYELLGHNSQIGIRNWTAFGPTCDPVDVLPFTLRLPDTISEGDVIRFDQTGAYSTATATRFNGFGGIEVRIIED